MTTPLDDHEAPSFYQAVLDVGEELHQQNPDGVETQFHGMTAWHSLTCEQQADQLPLVLGAYVQLVHEEEREMRLNRDAADPTHTYLGDADLAVLWDCAASRKNAHGEVRADRQALVNVLCELELLQHRLRMVRDELPGGSK